MAVPSGMYDLTDYPRLLPEIVDAVAEEVTPPYSNMKPERPITVNTPAKKVAVPVTDNGTKVDQRHWYTFAKALLIDEVNFSRDAVVKATWLSQPIYNTIYAHMNDENMIGGVDGKLNRFGYDFLLGYLDVNEREAVQLPLPPASPTSFVDTVTN